MKKQPTALITPESKQFTLLCFNPHTEHWRLRLHHPVSGDVWFGRSLEVTDLFHYLGVPLQYDTIGHDDSRPIVQLQPGESEAWELTAQRMRTNLDETLPLGWMYELTHHTPAGRQKLTVDSPKSYVQLLTLLGCQVDLREVILPAFSVEEDTEIFAAPSREHLIEFLQKDFGWSLGMEFTLEGISEVDLGTLMWDEDGEEQFPIADYMCSHPWETPYLVCTAYQ